MNALQAIATLTSRQETEIKLIDTWDKVLLVQFVKGSGRFVSFKKFVALMTTAPTIKDLVLVIPAGRKGAKPWVAAIKGTDVKYGLKRVFVEGDITWNGRKGAEKGEFTITAPGTYQCGATGSTGFGDYFVVEVVGGALEYRDISWQEARDLARQYDATMDLLAA
jgi:hypothetical protein